MYIAIGAEFRIQYVPVCVHQAILVNGLILAVLDAGLVVPCPDRCPVSVTPSPQCPSPK